MFVRCLAILTLACFFLFGCSETSDHCDRLSSKVINQIKTECSISKPGCGGNPGLDYPVVEYTKHHHDDMQEIVRSDCEMPDLGIAPYLCFAGGGSPECPEGYECCTVGGEQQCRKDCTDGGVGPDVGPRPDVGTDDVTTDSDSES